MAKRDIVPIGKYRGEPVQRLIADKDYCEWLLGQAWLVERYRDLYEAIVAQGGEQADTPEHNALQARFLDANFCELFVRAVRNKFPTEAKAKEEAEKRRLSVIAQLADKQETLDKRIIQYEAFQKHPADNYRAEKATLEDLGEPYIADQGFAFDTQFEVSGWDVVLRTAYTYRLRAANSDKLILNLAEWDDPRRIFEQELSVDGALAKFYVECKPSLGDNYPAVLRQVQGYPFDGDWHRIVLLERFAAAGATFEQVKQIFARSSIQLITLDELIAN